MQGSARLAVRVASQVTGVNWRDRDFFFVVRSASPVIGGPSAGATLAVGAVAALTGWTVREDAILTGTINPDGSVGPVGGVPEKAMGARDAGMTLFLFPAGQQVQLVDGAPTDLPQWCQATLGIECAPVTDVVDAVNRMTDRVIERVPPPANVTDESFRARLAPLAAQLRAEAGARLDEADAAVAALDNASAAPWRARLALARSTLANAESAATNGSHYTSSSLSFQTSIEGRAVRDSARLLASTQQGALLASLVDEARAAVETAARDIEARVVETSAQFETVGSAQVRLLEAERRLELAATLQAEAADINTALNAVYEAAYAVERARTATWWLGLEQGSPPGPSLVGADLEQAAQEAVTVAQESVAYVDAVLAESMGPGVASGATAVVEQAKSALERGFAPAAVLLAHEAEVRAASVLEAGAYGGAVPEAKFEAARVAAARAIAEARARGVEPLLAQSQYEFGLTLQAPQERLSFLGLARVSANLAGRPDALDAGKPAALETRFQELPRFPGAPPAWIPAAFAVGLALGVGAGLTALMPRERKDEEKESKDPGAQAPE